MPDEEVLRDSEPMDRLTRICLAMTDAMDAHPEIRPGDKAIVMMNDSDRGGIQLHGYDGDVAEAVSDLLQHLRAMLRSSGVDLEVIAIPKDASRLDEG